MLRYFLADLHFPLTLKKTVVVKNMFYTKKVKGLTHGTSMETCKTYAWNLGSYLQYRLSRTLF